MSKRANPTVVGAFVVGAIALAVACLVLLGGLQAFKHELRFVMFFEGSLSGLDVGSPVQIRGVKIGEVARIRLFPNTPKIGVYVDIDPSLLPKGGAVRQNAEAVQTEIKEGLRAQLHTQSLVTGQLIVYLDYFPGTAIVLAGLDPSVREIPTVPTTLAQFQARIEAVLSKLDKVKLDELITDVTLTAKGARELMASPELKATIVSANEALQEANKTLKGLQVKLDSVGSKTDEALVETKELIAETRKLVARVDAQVDPLASSIKDTSTSAQGTLRALGRTIDGDSRVGYDTLRTLQDVGEAARALKALADYLERHPEALLRGKGGSNSQ